MSGTSVDAIDAVLLEVTDDGLCQLRQTTSQPFPPTLRDDILALMQPGDNEIDRAGAVHTALGERYASVARELIPSTETVAVIGCHGQTVRHRPDGDSPFTLQLGSGAVIASRTGIPVVADFRSADMAAGGQGAPFAPFFHRHVFSSPSANRAIINLGGIANITLLPRQSEEPVIGFDSGPANCLMDIWVNRKLGLDHDEDGRLATRGRVNDSLLRKMLVDPYFRRKAPKSTGREYFNQQWLDRHLDLPVHSVSTEDGLATLAMLTARSITMQLPASVDEIYLCGGGSANQHLRSLLGEITSLPVEDTSVLGIPPQWIEASAFGWMALSTLQARACTLPSVTGARRATVAGAVYYP